MFLGYAGDDITDDDQDDDDDDDATGASKLGKVIKMFKLAETDNIAAHARTTTLTLLSGHTTCRKSPKCPPGFRDDGQ